MTYTADTDTHLPRHADDVDPVVARWESRGGAYWLELTRNSNTGGYSYECSNGGGFLGGAAQGLHTDADAVAYIERPSGIEGKRWVDIKRPDANLTPMRRVR